MQSTILPPPPPIEEYEKLTEYEKDRAKRIKHNNEYYESLNLPKLSAGFNNSIQKGKGKGNEKKCNGGDDDYDPGKEDGSEGDVSVTPPKVYRFFLFVSYRTDKWKSVYGI